MNNKKNKKYSDSRLREIAHYTNCGCGVNLIASLIDMPANSVAHIVWIYNWSPEKLREMLQRSKLHGPKGESARTSVRKYFVMHPEQRPVPMVKNGMVDNNTQDQLDLTFDSEQNKRLDKIEQYLSTIGVELNDRIGTIRSAFDELTERTEEIDRSIGATHNLHCSHASRICNIEKILKQDVIDGNAHSRIDAMADQITQLVARIDELKNRIDNQKFRLDDMQIWIDDMQNCIDDAAKRGRAKLN